MAFDIDLIKAVIVKVITGIYFAGFATTFRKRMVLTTPTLQSRLSQRKTPTL